MGTIFTLAIAAATGREFVHNAPATTIVGGVLMTLGAGLLAATGFADPQLKKGMAFYTGRALLFAGMLCLALGSRR